MGFVKVGKMLSTMLATNVEHNACTNVEHNAGTNVGHNAGTNVQRHFCDTLPSHRDCVADDLEQPGRKKRMNDKKRHVLCFGLSLANVLKYSGWLDYH